MASNNPQWDGKPHLVLYWLFDIPNQTLTCKIGDDLEYLAHQGGYAGYTKRQKNADGTWRESRVEPMDWQIHEKTWISENYGEIVGYFQYDHSRTVTHPIRGTPDHTPNGVGPDGRYIDHMQRLQAILEGEDMASIWQSPSKIWFVTPDRGATIYKKLPTRNVLYPNVNSEPEVFWPEHPQPCMMQPYSPGVRLSSYDEMEKAGVPDDMINRCKQWLWPTPRSPELQKWYIYPTVIEENPVAAGPV